MPIPSFVPIIGRDFSDVGAQTANWAGFSRSVEESNIQRQLQADREQQNYLAQVADLQQRAADRETQRADAAAAEARNNVFLAQQRADQQATQKEAVREFDVSQQTTKDIALGKQKMFQDQQTAAVEAKGATYSQSYGKAVAAQKQADDAYEKLQSQLDDNQVRLAELTAKSEKTPDEQKEIGIINRNMAALSKPIRQLKAQKDKADTHYNSVLTALQNDHFEPDDEEGTLTHKLTGKTFSFKSLLKKATEDADITAPKMFSFPSMIGTETMGEPPPQSPMGGMSPILPPPSQTTAVRPNKRFVWDATQGIAVPAQ